MMTLPQHRILTHNILADPGDEITRLALADLAQEKDIDLECLRRAGWWAIAWNSGERCWYLEWHSFAQRVPTQWMHGKPTVYRIVKYDPIGVCSLSQKELPRCIYCQGRAHVCLPPLWQWECGGNDADVAKRCQEKADLLRRTRQACQHAADTIRLTASSST